jgi:hypothetical protein
MEIIFALALGILVIFGAIQNWKFAIKSILVLVIIEGALRRWAFPQARDLIYFLKDFVLISAYIGFYNRPRPLVDRYSFLKELLLVITIFCCLQAFNPSLGSPIVGLLGIRAYLLYIPLIWIVPHLFHSETDLHNFLRNYLFILFPVCILGIIQYFSPPDSPLNTYIAGEEAGVATIGNFVRITGTFSYLVGLTTYLSVCFTLLIIFISQDTNPRWQLVYIFELTLVIINSFMSGARFIIVYEVLFLVGYFICLLFNSYRSALKLIVRMFVPIVLVTIVAVVYFQPALDAFNYRATNSDSVEDRIFGSFTQVFDYAGDRFDGYGTGATQPSANSLRKILDLPSGEELPPSEVETGRVVIELGVIGFILWYSLRVLLLLLLYSVFCKLKNLFYKELALGAFLFQIINLTGQLVTNPTMLVYFWFFSGFIYLLPTLESQEDQQNTFTNLPNK